MLTIIGITMDLSFVAAYFIGTLITQIKLFSKIIPNSKSLGYLINSYIFMKMHLDHARFKIWQNKGSE